VALYDPKLVASDAELVEQMKLMSLLYPRFGYRRIAIMLHESIKRVRRLWGRHGQAWAGMGRHGQAWLQIGREQAKTQAITQQRG
jgi:hypothetical protein